MSKLKLNNATPLAFIPAPLQIDGREDLTVFSLNIFFVSYANIDGIDYSGSTLYQPNLATFLTEGNTRSLSYINPINHRDYIVMRYDALQESYEADKYIRSRKVGHSKGADWKSFFINLTAHGLYKHEGCEFTPL